MLDLLTKIALALTNINIIFYLLAYFIGGIPFGLILAKVFAKTNIKEEGSKSIGATNVLRVLKTKDPKLAKKLAIATILLDALKGVAIIAVANMFGLSVASQWLIGILAIIGHCFSPYLKLEGGKGVATAVGVMMWFLPLEVAIALVIWFILAKTVKISSVSSLGALMAFIIATYIIHYEMPVINTHAPVIIVAIIIIYKHIPNIIRLFTKEEKKVI